MTTNNDTQIKDIEEKLQNIIEETKKVNQDILELQKLTATNFDTIESEIDVVIQDIDSACQDLEQEEKLAADEIDQLILEHAEASTKE